MTSKTFVPGTVIDSPWLNDVNTATYVTIPPLEPLVGISSTTDATKGASLIGWFKTLTNFVGRTLSAKLSDQYSVTDYGAVGDGVTDNTTFFTNCPSGSDLLVPPGIYLVNNNVTISASLRFAVGAILKPASGKTISLTKPFSALPQQIFDLSLGGLIALPQGCSVVCAEWWGAQAYPSTYVTNEIPINQAISALNAIATGAGTLGGTVTLERGTFYISGTINLMDEVWLEGKGHFFCSIRAQPLAFPTNSYMFLAKNGTSSMFNCGIRSMRLTASNDYSIKAVIYAPAWQQKSGLRNVWIENFCVYGLLMDTGYGGATMFTLDEVEIFTGTNASGAICISFDYSNYTVGWFSVLLKNVQCGTTLAPVVFTAAPSSGTTSATLTTPWLWQTGSWNVQFNTGEFRFVTFTNGATTATWSSGLSSNETVNAVAVPPLCTGILAKGNTILDCQDFHCEFIQNSLQLQTGANVVGNVINSDGSSSVQAIFNCSSNWTGYISANGVSKAGAISLIADTNRPLAQYPLSNVTPINGNLYWPPDPRKAVGALVVAGGASPTISWQKGEQTFTVAHTATGQLTVNMSPGMGNFVNYAISVTSNDPSVQIASAQANLAGQFYIFTRTAANVATDAALLFIEVFPKT